MNKPNLNHLDIFFVDYFQTIPIKSFDRTAESNEEFIFNLWNEINSIKIKKRNKVRIVRF